MGTSDQILIDVGNDSEVLQPWVPALLFVCGNERWMRLI